MLLKSDIKLLREVSSLKSEVKALQKSNASLQEIVDIFSKTSASYDHTTIARVALAALELAQRNKKEE